MAAWPEGLFAKAFWHFVYLVVPAGDGMCGGLIGGKSGGQVTASRLPEQK